MKNRFILFVVVGGFSLGVTATLIFQQVASRKIAATPIRLISGPHWDGEVWRRSQNPGPWGMLEYLTLPLEPDEVFQDKVKQSEGSTWYFANCSSQQVAEFLSYCDLTRSQRDELFTQSVWKDMPSGFAVTPPSELILELSGRAVQRIYPVLERSPANFPPFRFPLNGFDAEFGDSGLSPERLELLRRLTYTNGGRLSFSAIAPIRACFSTNEMSELVRALYRTAALSMRLHVDENSDICSLVSYWGAGARGKVIRPLLESLARIPGGGGINVSYFFSPFARVRLYTYPDPETDDAVFKEDCFFTALNFFNDQPDPKYTDRRNSLKALRDDYSAVTNATAFGDLIMLVDDSGTGIHVCVFVADDTVFTKNGTGLLEPWVLMRIPDMVVNYPSDKPLRMVYFRRNEIPKKLRGKMS